VGYGLSGPDIMTQLHKVRPPFNVNSVALQAAVLALKNTGFVDQTRQMNNEGKRYLEHAFEQMGLKVLSSQANFLCVFLPKPAPVVTQALLQKGIIVRSLAGFGLDHAIRVTIGLPDQNQRFIKALSEVLTGH
jgi:histidinol-phosphate aminotransferase